MQATRKLVAIMFTDIVGYTALMGKDETRAFTLLQKSREIHLPIIETFQGRWIKEIGDGVLATFTTISDAVKAAVSIQKATNATGEFQLRIGIHSGEVLVDNNDVFGDSVNIASRIQAIAEPGAIFISEPVYQNIFNKDFSVAFRKEEHLKNVREPVRIYEVSYHPAAAKAVDLHPFSLKKSIAVLPFTNMSSDPEQDYFSDGITEEIITDLSHLHELLVISRQSVMTFKNSGKIITEIAKELNTHYVLVGSVRKAGRHIRITTQLIDAKTDTHLWAEKYAGTLDDVFDIQEKVARSIVAALKIRLSAAEDKVISEHPLRDVHTYECYLKARKELIKWNKETTDKAKFYIEEGLRRTGPNPLLYGTLAYVYWSYGNQGFDQNANYTLAKHYVEKTLELDPDAPLAHLVLGNMQWTHYGNLQKSFVHYKQVLKITPNDFDATMWLSVSYALVGQPRLALAEALKLRQIDPLNLLTHVLPVTVKFYDGQFEEAVEGIEDVYKQDPENVFFQVMNVLFNVYCKKFPKVIDFIRNHVNANSGDMVIQLTYMFLHALEGKKEHVQIWLQQRKLHETAGMDCQYAQIISVICALAGLNQEALLWLETAIDHGFINYPFLSNCDHILADRLGDDTNYKRLLSKSKQKWETFAIDEKLS